MEVPASDLKRVRLHRTETGAGAGPAIVLSHGLGDDSSTWDGLLPQLGEHRRVVAWDLRGHGRSEAPADPGAYTPVIGVEDLIEVIEGAGAPVHLVGHSLGGLLTLTVALRRPELVRSLTLVASGPGFRDPGALAAWNRSVDEAVRSMPVPAAAAGLARQESSWVIDHLGDVTVPTLVIIGDRDERFTAAAAVFERRVPGCVCLRLAGAGHHVQRVHAREVAAAVLAHAAAADEGAGAR